MNKILRKSHTISALSNFNPQDLPKPFCNNDYYSIVLRNLFTNKNSNLLVKFELQYEVTEYSYMSIKVYAPTSKGIFIEDIIDIEQFVNWYSAFYGKIIDELDTNYKTAYIINDYYTSNTIHNIHISFNQYDNYIYIVKKTEINI